MGCGVGKEKTPPAVHTKLGEPTLVIVVGADDTKKTIDDPDASHLARRPGSILRIEAAVARQHEERRRSGVACHDDLLDRDLNAPPQSPKGLLASPRHGARFRRRTLRMQEFGEQVGDLLNRKGSDLKSSLNKAKGINEDEDNGDAMDESDLQKRLTKLFNLMDANKSGTISMGELRAGFKQLGWAHNPEAVTRMFGLKKGEAEKDDFDIDRPTFDKLFRHLTSIDDLVVGAEMDAVGPGTMAPSAPKRSWLPGTRPLRSWGVRCHPGHRTRVKCVAMSPTQRTYATCHREDTVLHLHDLDDGKRLRTFQGHQDTILCCALSPDKKHLATASRDGLMMLFDCTCGHMLKELEHPGVVTCCAFTPNGKNIVSGCHDSVCRKYDVSRGRLLHSTEHDSTEVYTTKGVVVTIVCGQSLIALTRARHKKVEILDAADLSPRHSLSGHEALVWALSFSPDHRYVVSTCEKYIHVWGQFQADKKGPDGRIMSPSPRRKTTPGEDQETTPSEDEFDNDTVDLLVKRWVVGDERVGKPAPPRPAAVQGSALAQRGPAWLTACFCPGDFAHLVAAVCSDLSLTVFHNDPDGAALLTVFTRSPVYCLSPSRDYSELGFGDEFGNVYILTLE